MLGTWFFLFLFAYFSIHVAIRVLICDSLELDEAEQVLLSQWVLPGYTAQPPLYAWLQILFFRVFGLNVAALSLLKNSLLLTTYILVYLNAKQLFSDSRLAVLSTLSLLLTPQIAWGSQRDLTHTVLVVTVSTAALYAALGLLKSRSILRYCLLGAVLGLGILSKYNFAIFALSLLLAILTTGRGREIFMDKRILFSAAVALLVASPHLWWLLSHPSVASPSIEKLKMGNPSDLLKGLGDLARAMLLFLTPLWIIYLALFPSGFKRNRHSPQTEETAALARYFLFLVGILATMVLIFHFTHFKTRWMQPFLFPFPIYFFTRLDRFQSLDETAYRRFCKIAVAAALAILIIFPLRVVGASLINSYSRFNYPFNSLSEGIRVNGFDEGVIVGERGFTAGNLHLRFPESRALVPELKAMDISSFSDGRPLLIVWDAEESFTLPRKLREFLKKRFHVGAKALSPEHVRYIMAPYRYSRKRFVAVGTILLHGDFGRKEHPSCEQTASRHFPSGPAQKATGSLSVPVSPLQ